MSAFHKFQAWILHSIQSVQQEDAGAYVCFAFSSVCVAVDLELAGFLGRLGNFFVGRASPTAGPRFSATTSTATTRRATARSRSGSSC